MVLYQPHIKVDGDEAKELAERLKSQPRNDVAAETLREARKQHPNPKV